MGQVSLEYCYQLALAQLRARHLGLEIEEDPFTLLPEDANMPMADEQPIDDSTLPGISPFSDYAFYLVGAFPVRGELAPGPSRVTGLGLPEYQVAYFDLSRAYFMVVKSCYDLLICEGS
ncbi:hypothetical protein GW17_00030214 [Ensete ventricosum]|nr:hypothetical protein GW17_00030214 [Ensete ventricosum]